MAAKQDNASRRAAARRSGDADYQKRRAQIVEAAGRVFRRKGLQATNLNDIAHEAGVDRASMYYYVAGKQELFEEVAYEAVHTNLSMARAIAAQDLAPPEKVRRMVEQLMSSYEEHYPYLFVYVQENMAQLQGDVPWQESMRAMGRQYADLVTGAIQDGVDAGSIVLPPSLTARLAAFALIGMCNWSHRWFRPSGTLSGSEIGQAFSSIFMDGIRA